jgi:hypothetical protein
MLAVFVRYLPKYHRGSHHGCRRPFGGIITGASPTREGRRIAETGAIDFALACPDLLPARSRRAGAGGAYRIDFLVGRKPPEGFLREHQAALDRDLERPANSRHQLDFGAVTLNQPRPRTEGPRFIVSRLAPLDRYFHLRPPSPLPHRCASPRDSTMISARVSGSSLVFAGGTARASKGRHLLRHRPGGKFRCGAPCRHVKLRLAGQYRFTVVRRVRAKRDCRVVSAGHDPPVLCSPKTLTGRICDACG